MRSDIWYYCWWETAAQVISSSHFAMACHAASSAILSFSASVSRASWDRAMGGLKEDADGKERHFLKGSSQWDQKDVHNHSVNKLGDGREESTFPFVFLWKFLTRPMMYNGTDGGRFQEYTAVSAKVVFDLSSLNGWGSPYLCCRKPWVPFECLTVWLIGWVSSEGKVELLRPDLAEKERNVRQDFCIST